MNREIIRDELNWLIEAINEQYEAIRAQGDKVPQIELDILMENVRKFYQDLRLLQRVTEPVPLQERSDYIPKAAPAPAPVVEPREPEPPVVVSYDDPVDYIPAVPAPGFAEPVVDYDDPEPAPAPVHFTPAGPASVKREAAPARKPVREPEPDLFAEEEPAFSIKLKSARELSLGPKSPPEKVENLKTAITINEKFMFINELFDGNLREYNETIETLNGFMTLAQATDYLDLMRRKNFWNTGSNAFRKLHELVERKF